MPDIIDAVFEHHEAVDSERKGKALPFVWIDSCRLEDIWVDESGAENLEPFVVPSHIHFYCRLDEWEIARSEADFGVWAEEFLEDVLERSLQLCERDFFVDEKSFKLEELRFVSGVSGFVPKNFSWNDDTERRLVVLHIADLNRRCLRGEESSTELVPVGVGLIDCLFLYPKRILHVAGRMILGQI